MLRPKRPADSATEMVQVVLPNDANPLGFILGGTVMHLIDIAGAIACHRHTRSLLVTAAVDGLQFLHSIKVGDLIILKSKVTAAWSTSLEVEVEVFSEETLTGVQRMTSRAYLTFVAIDRDGERLPVPGLILESDDEKQRAREADVRRAARLEARKAIWRTATWPDASRPSVCIPRSRRRRTSDRCGGSGSRGCSCPARSPRS